MRPWLEERAAREPFRSELERIALDYTADVNLDTKNGINPSLRNMLAGRVRSYARAALE